MWRLLSRRREDWLPFPLALWFWLGPAALAWVVAGAGLPVVLAVLAYSPADLPGEWPRLESALAGVAAWPAALEGAAWVLVAAGVWSYVGYALFTCAPARRVRIWRDALVREYASWRRDHDRDVKGERVRAGRCGRLPRRILGWTGATRTGAPSWRRLHAMRWARADEVLTLARRLAVISAGVVSGMTLAWQYGLLRTASLAPGIAPGTLTPRAWEGVTRAVAEEWLGVFAGIVPGLDLERRLGFGPLAGPAAYDIAMGVLALAVLVPLACYAVQVLRDPRDLDPEWPFEDGPAVIAVAQRIGWEDGDLPRSAGGWTGAFTDAARRLDREELTPPPGSRRWTAEDVWNDVTDALDDPPPEWLPTPHPT